MITTKNLKRILEENYTRGVNGRDFAGDREELQADLWERQNKEAERIMKEEIKKYNSK